MAKAIAILIAYNLIFWRHHYANPFRQSTGELLSTFYAHWQWAGKRWARLRIPLTDKLYYQFPGCIPFLSTFYPPHMLSSLLSVHLSRDVAFALLACMVYAHFALASILAYYVFSAAGHTEPVALFGAITLTYAGYMIKPQNPCIVYTNAWLPGVLLGGPFGGFCLGMAILGGYWPVIIYTAPILIMLSWRNDIAIAALIAFVVSLPQVLPFCWYWPKSIRAHRACSDWKFGSVPLTRWLDLIIPDLSRTSINGVLFNEMSMYAGISAFIFALRSTISIWLGVLVGAFLLAMRFAPQRIPARWLHTFTYALTFLAVGGMSRDSCAKTAWLYLILQAFDLLRNAAIQPLWPFCEWWRRPSEHIALIKKRVGDFRPDAWRVVGLPFPFFTGYLLGWRTLGYSGGFCLKAMADFRGTDTQFGESAHDRLPTRMNEYGVRYIYKNGAITENKEAFKPSRDGILEELRCLTQPISNK